MRKFFQGFSKSGKIFSEKSSRENFIFEKKKIRKQKKSGKRSEINKNKSKIGFNKINRFPKKTQKKSIVPENHIMDTVKCKKPDKTQDEKRYFPENIREI